MRRSGELLRSVVGGSGVVVNEGLLWVFKQFVGLPLLASSAIAVEASIISNFTLNYFTSVERPSQGSQSFAPRFFKFNAVRLSGIGVNLGVLYLFTNVVGVYYLISNLIGIVIAFVWNYLLTNWWTWK